MRKGIVGLRIVAFGLLLAFMPVASGCSAVISNLPHVIAAVTDAQLALDAIEAFIHRMMENKPVDPGTKARVDLYLSQARAALQLALRTTQGAEHLSQADVDNAFSAFRAAYAALLELVHPFGVSQGDGDSLRAGPGTLVVPEPLALTLKVK